MRRNKHIEAILTPPAEPRSNDTGDIKKPHLWVLKYHALNKRIQGFLEKKLIPACQGKGSTR